MNAPTSQLSATIKYLPLRRLYVGSMTAGNITVIVTGSTENQCAERPLQRYGSEVGDVTGILVRAKNSEDHWDSVDIAHLDRESLDAWLRSRDSIEWPINVVMLLLGHKS